MANIRLGDAGITLSAAYLDRFGPLQITEQTGTEIDAEFSFQGRSGYAVRLLGHFGPAFHGLGLAGTISEYRETLNGVLRFELTGIGVPYLARTTPLSLVLAGDDTLQGDLGNDRLPGFAGSNVINGGGGIDTAVVDAARSATLSFRWRNEAVVFRSPGQSDRLSDVEFVSFNDRDYGTFEFPEVRPLEYLASYADLAQAYRFDEFAAWRHFAGPGLAEGRSIAFSGLNYIASYRDLAQAFGADANAGARHYLASGRAEGRTVSFDGLRYIASYNDLIPVLPHTIDAGAMHFISSGAAEGRTVTFDPLRYLASNLDVARAYGTDEARGLDHWLEKGFTENRQTASFDAAQYLANYADLRAAFDTDQRAATLHWIQTGAAEGRSYARPYEPPRAAGTHFTISSTTTLYFGSDFTSLTTVNAPSPSPTPP